MPAFALGKVYSPNVVKGELEVEYGASVTFDRDASKNNIQSHELEVEYGLTNRLLVGFESKFKKEMGEPLRSSKFELNGRYQFFEQGENWLDSGLMLAYAHATHHDDADAMEAKLLLEKQVGKTLHRANLVAEQEIGSHGEQGLGRAFSWSSRYRYSPYFEPGFEIQSDFGKANAGLDFNEQQHYVGPAIYGKIMPGLKYEAAYYAGASDAASASAARVQLEYEMFF